jgi:hypothetical protein
MIFLFATLSGVLYRLGGKYQTKIRDCGVPTIAIITLLYLNGWKFNIPALIITWGLLFASLTTYWKKKGTDARWWNWALTGLGYSLAFLPIVIVNGGWWGFGLRSVILTASITLWSQIVGKDWIEEWGRGALIILTIPIPY